MLGDNFGFSQHASAADLDDLVWLELEDQMAASVVHPTPERQLGSWNDQYSVLRLPVGNVELFGCCGDNCAPHRLQNDRQKNTTNKQTLVLMKVILVAQM